MTERDELWVETDAGRFRLDGNAHTAPGRIAVWSDAVGSGVTLSKSDVRDASPEAWAWIDGFLAGSEPELYEFLGIDALDADLLADDAPAIRRYQDAMAIFRATGSLPYPIERRPTLAPPAGLPRAPWSAAGGEVLGWVGRAWQPLVPQPELTFALIVGTICAERAHHELTLAGDHHVYCADCGELTEVVAPG